jgi:ABC-type nitrate/sulfonate/bicarbonate transport system substrate-binding protein
LRGRLRAVVLAGLRLLTVSAAVALVSSPSVAAQRLRVTTIGFANEILVAWGAHKGVFARNGLDVELVKVTGGSAALAAVISGAADIGFSNGLTSIIALSQGFPIQIVAQAYENAYPPDRQRGRGVVVSAKGAITGACGLVGGKVATNELGGIGQIYASAWIRKNGCNPDDVRFVALPPQQLAAAVESGRVDAAVLTSSAAHDLVARGIGRNIGEPMAETSGRVAFGVYIAARSFIDANRPVVGAFRRALDETLREIESPANRDEVVKLQAAFGRTTVAVLTTTQQERLATRVDREVLQKMVDVLVSERILSKPVDVAALLLQD